MIKVPNYEQAVRTVEVFNAMSAVLPLYDDEARHFFRGTFQLDITDLMPKFFMALSMHAVKHPAEFKQFLDYFLQLCAYAVQARDDIPMPANTDKVYFDTARTHAEQMVKSWNVKQVD